MKALRVPLAAVTLVLSLVLVAPASADPPPRTPIPLPDPFVLPGGEFCNFDVRVTYTNINEVFTTRTNPDGSTTFRVTGSAFATVTNVSTGKSLQFNISGPGTQTVFPDGTSVTDAHGPNLFWTTRTNSFAGVPFLAYSTGHVTFTLDPSGKTIAYSVSGRRTDVCAALA
jgi:hypothetical protein